MILNFVLFRMMPGSPERVLLSNPHLTRRSSPQVRARWGLDKPLIPDQLVAYIDVDRCTGDLGYSIKYRGQPVTEVVGERSGRRSCSSGSARSIAIVVGCGSAPYAGWKRGGTVDRVGNGVSLILYSMPYFVIGMPLIIIFAAGLDWFPTSGMTTPGGDHDRRRAGSSTSAATSSCR